MRQKILFSLTLLFSIHYAFSQSKSNGNIAEGINWVSLADSLQEVSYNTYLSSDKKYFLHDNAGNTKFNYWWNAHALDVFVDAYNRTKDKSYISKMKALIAGIKATNEGSFYNDFYDDMEWLALSLLRAFEATKDQEFLDITKLLWKDIQTAANGTMGGGFAWRKSQRYYKNTPANAPAIILAARLYQLNKEEPDLTIAKNLYSWLKKTLVDTNTGFVKDGINREQNGKIDPWKLTYNQGIFIGAGLELFKITGDRSFLDDAIKTADFVIEDPDFVPGGILKAEGNEDGGLFKGILIRYLVLLSQEQKVSKLKRESYQNFIKVNAEALAKKGIRKPEMLVGIRWDKPPGKKTDYSTQLSGIMLIEAMTRLK